jgi:hypothetical protein
MTREEKYKAKQAIDAFFMRAGDVISAGVVYLGAKVLHLGVPQFAMVNVSLTLAWLAVAFLILRPQVARPRVALRPLATAAAALAIVIALAGTASAQDTREEQLARQRAEKAANLHAYTPTPLEQRVERVERAMDLFTTSTVYPFVGSVLEGGGVAVGPGVRAFYGDTGRIDAHAAWSMKGYKAVEGTVALPTFANGRVTVESNALHIDAPDVAFYGVGNASSDVRRGFAYKETTVGVTSRIKAARFFSVGGGVDAMRFDAGSRATAPSLTRLTPNYGRTRLFAEFDTRTSPGYTRRGTMSRAEWSNYLQTNGDASSFGRVDAEVQQFIPILRENWVIALRALASTTTTGAGNEVPFFLLPELGNDTLRGYSSWRFRDRSRMLFTGEYRWTAGSFVDMSLFIDAGQVARRLQDMDARSFNKTYGIGMSIHTPTSTVLRVALARTPEGNSLVFAVGPSF